MFSFYIGFPVPKSEVIHGGDPWIPEPVSQEKEIPVDYGSGKIIERIIAINLDFPHQEFLNWCNTEKTYGKSLSMWLLRVDTKLMSHNQLVN